MGTGKPQRKDPDGTGAVGRPRLPDQEKKRHLFRLRFDDEQLALIEKAALADDDDKLVNWLKRMCLRAARRKLNIEKTSDLPSIRK